MVPKLNILGAVDVAGENQSSTIRVQSILFVRFLGEATYEITHLTAAFNIFLGISMPPD